MQAQLMACEQCGKGLGLTTLLGSLNEGKLACPHCGQPYSVRQVGVGPYWTMMAILLVTSPLAALVAEFGPIGVATAVFSIPLAVYLSLRFALKATVRLHLVARSHPAVSAPSD